MHTKKAVTGQQELLENRDGFPAVGERIKLGLTTKDVARGPNKSPRKLGPKRYSQTFKAVARPKLGGLDVSFDRGDLEREVPKRTGTNVHLECVGGGELAVVIRRL